MTSLFNKHRLQSVTSCSKGLLCQIRQCPPQKGGEAKNTKSFCILLFPLTFNYAWGGGDTARQKRTLQFSTELQYRVILCFMPYYHLKIVTRKVFQYWKDLHYFKKKSHSTSNVPVTHNDAKWVSKFNSK